ncbi:MAG: hypothetical protein EOP86_26665, partial [Verrucomicrobiaceae bacterium]
LGDGTTDDRGEPVPAVGMTDVRAVSAGKWHSLFLKISGTAWASGANFYGQLGDGTTTDRSTPVRVLEDVQAVAAGEEHSLFLKTDGTVWGTGSNYVGQLGDSTEDSRILPVQVQGFTGVQSIAVGYAHSLFLKADGSAWATGLNSEGQLGDGSLERRNHPVQVLSGVRAIAAGAYWSLFLKTDGTVLAAGHNGGGQAGLGLANQRTPVVVYELGVDPGTAWQREQFGAGAGAVETAGWMADPDHDGVVNLLERAFNLPPLQSGSPLLAPGTGSAGLPRITARQKPFGPVLVVEYLRLKGWMAAGLEYTAQFSSAPEDGAGWMAANGVEKVESINDFWERVTLEDSVSVSPLRRFARVKVTAFP